MTGDEKQDRSLGRTAVLYRVAAAVCAFLVVSNAVSGNTRAMAGFLAAACFAYALALVVGELRQAERDRRASDAALLDAHAALQEAHAEILASHANLQQVNWSVTEEQMRTYFGLPQKEQR